VPTRPKPHTLLADCPEFQEIRVVSKTGDIKRNQRVLIDNLIAGGQCKKQLRSLQNWVEGGYKK